MRTSVLLGVSIVCLASVAHAGDDPRFDAWAFGGTSLFNAAENRDELCRDARFCSFQIRRRFSTSPLGGLGVGYRFGRRSHLDVSVAIAPWHRLGTRATGDFLLVPIAFERDVVASHLGVTARYDLGTSRARWFVAAGLARIYYVAVDDLPIEDSGWDTALVIGGGVDWRLGSRLRGRVEILDHAVRDHLGTEQVGHDVHLRLGAGFRF
jgi:hypothetical protein